MTFALPQVLMLLVPLGVLLWRRGRVRGPAMLIRAALVTVITVALAAPSWRIRSTGSDLVVLVDRSRSMPAQSEAAATELVRLLESQRRTGDRVGVLGFGRETQVERGLSERGTFGGFPAAVDGEASNLAGALEAAFDLIPSERAGRVLVVSDGRATGLDARAAARRLAARGIGVDYRFLGRDQAVLDVAMIELQAPPSLPSKEPFLITATVKSTTATKGTFTLTRSGRVISRVTRDIAEGKSIITFPEVADRPGLVAYEVRVQVEGDGVPENDVAKAVVRVEEAPRVLLLTDKVNGALAQTLSASKLDLQVQTPAALGMAALEGVGVVVLEDVEAGRLSEAGLNVLAQFVTEAGGGLVMTGGRHAFGEGGYRKSVLEDVLPVSLEIREEQRKAAIALSIIMDCSCSMGVPIPDGRTKMELAAEGVVGALQLLNVRDEASVHMVDTGDHELFGLSPVSEGLPLGRVKRGFSGGGGIYIGEALRIAKREILTSTKPTRHVLLFADAADSEAADDAQASVAAMVHEGVTVSVIGMGLPTDGDAQLLRDIARWGNGRIYFAEDVTSLPRIFSQETIAVARASFIDAPTGLAVGGDWGLLGRASGASPPSVEGYNLTFRKPGTSTGLLTVDDNKAPIVAFWPRGAGRVVAVMAEVDGAATGALRTWSSTRPLLEETVRWAMPASVSGLDAVARTTVQGSDLHVTLDVPAEMISTFGAATLVLLSGDARVKPLELPLRWEDEDRLGAHLELPGSGTWHPVVKVGDRVYRAPPATLSWAPEFEPGSPQEGKSTLAAMAKAGGGVERLSMTGLFHEAPESEGLVPLGVPLIALAAVLMVLEVVLRRFWTGRVPAAVRPVVAALVEAPRVEPVEAPKGRDVLGDAKRRARQRNRDR